MAIAWVLWSLYDYVISENIEGNNEYQAGNKYFEDGLYQDALIAYRSAIEKNIFHMHAKRGIARSLMQLGEYSESLIIYNQVIAQEPDFAPAYGNRGILHDRNKNYRAAIKDYKQALRLNPNLANGPGWITRFLRNQVEKPPTILDRLEYLEKEIIKPEDKRVLTIKELDDAQRPYKM